MITLLRRYFWVMRNAEEQLRDDMDTLHRAVKQIDDWQQLALRTTDNAREILVAWRLSIEMPELDLRDDVDTMIREYEDQYARLSEQIL